MGGLRVVGSALASRFPELRAGAAHLIATISQNNPAVQPLVLKEHLLTVLLHMTTKDPDAAVQAKALLGVSGAFGNCDRNFVVVCVTDWACTVVYCSDCS